MPFNVDGSSVVKLTVEVNGQGLQAKKKYYFFTFRAMSKSFKTKLFYTI